MYVATVPYTNYNNQPKTKKVHFMLEIKDMYKVLPELNLIMNWQDNLEGHNRVLDGDSDEVMDFFNAFEKILLSAYGVPTADGEEFDRTSRYTFEQSAVFAALMVELLSDVSQTNKIINDLLPKGMDELVKRQTASLTQLRAENAGKPEIQAEIDRIRKAAAEASGEPVPGDITQSDAAVVVGAIRGHLDATEPKPAPTGLIFDEDK